MLYIDVRNLSKFRGIPPPCYLVAAAAAYLDNSFCLVASYMM
jgi:hypothetical protein